MKSLTTFVFVGLLSLLSCKEKMGFSQETQKPTAEVQPVTSEKNMVAAPSTETKSLTIQQIEKAMTLADSVKVIGTPKETVTEIWDSTLKKTVMRHETTTQMEIYISVDGQGYPIKGAKTSAAKVNVGKPGKVITGAVCTFSCSRSTPNATCSGASGCTFNQAAGKCNTNCSCGAGCIIASACSGGYTYGFAIGVHIQ